MMYAFNFISLWLFSTALAIDSAEQHTVKSATFCPLQPFGSSWRASGVCPINELRSSGNGTTTNPEDSWIRGNICHEIPGESESEYCTFTHPSFNHGLGISIITTREVFNKLANMSVFVEHENRSPQEGGMQLPYRDVPIPGKGIGLVAARPVEADDVYMSRTPAIMLDDTAFRLLGRSRVTALLVRAVDDLPYAHRAEYLNLTTHNEVESHGDKVYEIFMRNNFLTEVQNIQVFHSTFTQDYFFDDTVLSHNIFAARKINSGEELTVTYSDPFQTYLSRQMNLLHHWGFECTCSLCTASVAEIDKSDTRIEEIQSLWADLDNYTPDSAATPEKAERLIDLYYEEGLVTRMVEAYYRTAVEWNGAGDFEKARAFAEKAVGAGRIMESGIRPFLNNMRDLAKNPEGHWTWRFRVRGNT